MGTYHKGIWKPRDDWGGTRRQRAAGAYEWYLPTPLADLEYSLGEDVIGSVIEAEIALSRYTHPTAGEGVTGGLARLLMRGEAVGSSHIEGLIIGARRLIRAELEEAEPGSVRHDERAAEVLGNVRAMRDAIEVAAKASSIGINDILEIHRSLCMGTRLEPYGGVVRTSQNWVGGDQWSPLRAEYVPPAPKEVPALLEDLAQYCNRTDVPPVVQAALAHAQFESIHPFADGNGRCGRALTHVILARRTGGTGTTPPVSLVLATHAAEYMAGLSAMHYIDGVDDAGGHIGEWLAFFSRCCTRACAEGTEHAASLLEMRAKWASRLGGVRAGSAVELMLDEMVAMPIFTVEWMTRACGRTPAAIGNALRALEDAGIVVRTSKGKRSVVYEAPEVLEEFNLLERRLASPAGDTAIAPPVRAVPELDHGVKGKAAKAARGER